MDERSAWNQRYAAGSHTQAEPDPFLTWAYSEYVSALLPEGGTALDLAGGAGRNALWLGERGWRVTLVDVSEEGLRLARERGEYFGSWVTYLHQDLSETLPLGTYDLVLNFFFLERAWLASLPEKLNPGGLLVFKTYTQSHPLLSGGKGPKHPMYLLRPGELLESLRALEVLSYRETVKDKGIAEMVARKPA